MLPSVTTLYLLLSLNAVSLTAEEDLHETPRLISSASTHPEPGLPPDNRPDPAFLTSGETDPDRPTVVHLPSRWVPSEDTDGQAALGEYDDKHNSAEGVPLSDTGDALTPPERSVQEVTSSREEEEEEEAEEEEEEVEEEEEEDGLKGVGVSGERGPESSTEGPTPQGGLEAGSGWGAFKRARPNGRAKGRWLGSVPRPGSGTTRTSASVDLAPPTRDRGRADLSPVTAQDGPQDSQKPAEPTTNEDGLTECPLDKGNNSTQQKVEGKILKWTLLYGLLRLRSIFGSI